MRIIKNLIKIDLKDDDGDFLFVNGLNGCIDLLNSEEKSIIDKWISNENIIANSCLEEGLLQKLIERGYVMTETDEIQKKNDLILQLKKHKANNVDFNVAWFVITYGCNFACPYCYENDRKSNHVITKEMVDKIFEDNKQIKNIGFFGGEPFLPSNKEIIEYIIAKAPSAKYCVITNGYHLDEYIDILKKIDVSYVQVTLDGTEEKHNQTRHLHSKKPTFHKILQNVEKCVANNLPINIRMNISEDNAEDCYLQKSLIEATPWGKKVKFELQPLFQCSPKESHNLYDKIFVNDQIADTLPNDILQRMMPISNFLYNGTRLYPILKACDNDSQSRLYDANGDIYNCILAVGDRNKSIGTYYPKYELKDKSFYTRDITTIKKCQTCANSLLCGGGCPNGLPENMDVHSPNCYSFINEIEFMVPLIYKFRKTKVR